MVLLQVLDYLGTMVFAASGALKGVRKRMDVFGVAVLACVTAIGGGTMRDAFLDRRVFWLEDRTYMLVSVVVALGVFWLYRLAVKTERLLLILDAIGLGVFTAIGATKAYDAQTGTVGVVTLACLTGVGGGLIRDVLSGDVPIVLREEIYASASIAGALVFSALMWIGAPPAVTLCVSAGLTVLIRILSIVLHWHMPRRPDEVEEA